MKQPKSTSELKFQCQLCKQTAKYMLAHLRRKHGIEPSAVTGLDHYFKVIN